MSHWNEREIARKLAESDPIEPPAGLLEKIKGEIPPTIPVGVPKSEAGRPAAPPRPPRPPQQWLIAASLLAMVGAGFFALHLRMEPPRAAFANRPAAERKADGVRAGQAARRVPSPAEQPLGEPGGSEQALLAPPPPPPAVPKPLSRKDRKELQALGYAAPGDGAVGGVEGGVPGGVVGGVAGGTVAAAPAPAAPPPAAPPKAAPVQAAAVPTPAKPEAKPEPEQDRITVTAESPLLDERRISTGATVTQSELEKIPTAKSAPPAAAHQEEPAAPAVRDAGPFCRNAAF